MKKIFKTLITTLLSLTLFSALFVGVFADDTPIVGTGYEVMIPTEVEVSDNNNSFTVTSNLNSKYKLAVSVNSTNSFNLKYSTLDSVAYSLFHNNSQTPIENNYSFTLNNQEDSASEYTDTFAISIDGTPIYAETYTDTLTFTFDVTIPEHTLSFDVNGGNQTYDSQTLIEGATLGTLPTPTKDGCTFKGWFNEAISTTEPVTGSSLMGESDIELTAHWQVTITFNADGGTVNPSSKVIDEKTQIGTLPTPSKEGYTFAGWYSGDNEITSTSTISSNCTLTAHWSPNTYTITFNLNGGEWLTINYNANGGEMEGEASTYGNGGQAIGEMPTPSKTGYDFVGWYISGNEEAGEITSTYVPTAPLNLTAKWIPKTYTVTFYMNGGVWDN